MDKNEVLKILEMAKDKNGEVPMRLVRQAFEKLPESCEDAISRQDAIDILDAYQVMIENGEENPYAWARLRMSELPSAQLELRWIPVTEKLPEDEYVLISKKPTKLSGSKWCVTVAIRMADPRSGKIQWRDSGFGIIQDDEVLAWMPLPEPYREEGEEG